MESKRIESDFIRNVITLFKENDWVQLLELHETNEEEALSLTWVWPSISNLSFITEYLQTFNSHGVISIGCGCGLFEWFLQKFSDYPIVGFEANREWWLCKYSNPVFIPHVYPNKPFTEQLLNSHFALLFCYFNDNRAFHEYLNCYEGNLLFIIGPGDGRGTHTDPEPFKPHFEPSLAQDWALIDSQEVRETKDFIAVYKRTEESSGLVSKTK